MSQTPTDTQLPLFPLNLVLYPGMVLPLHIFEPRYQAMINQCLDERKPFGVVLIADGTAEGETAARPFSIGTTARIVQVQRMAEGRMNIWTVGETRFNLLDYDLTADSYLLGQVEYLEEVSPDAVILQDTMNTLSDLFDTYVNLLIKLNDEDPEDLEYELANDPNTLSYQVAAALNIASAEKQKLLEMDQAQDRLNLEVKILEREIDLLNDMLRSQTANKTQELPWGGEVNLN